MEEYIVEIKKIKLDDVVELQKISQQTFKETYSAGNSEEDMKKYLEENLSLERLSSEIECRNSEFYFAVNNDTVIGYLKLNFGSSQTELKNEKSLEIERIYVERKFQGKNVGHLFYEKALHVAQNLKIDYIWLGVWEENTKAILFYKKKGFIEFDKHVFKLGNDEQVDIMMKLSLKV